jgi:hypothetical protein
VGKHNSHSREEIEKERYFCFLDKKKSTFKDRYIQEKLG